VGVKLLIRKIKCKILTHFNRFCISNKYFIRFGGIFFSSLSHCFALICKLNVIFAYSNELYIMKYRRILLKLSGESLAGGKGHGIDAERLNAYATQIKQLNEKGVQVAIVIGGGNIFRGLAGAAAGLDRVKGDQMGMLATVINSLALSSALEQLGTQAVVFTAVGMYPIGQPYSPHAAIHELENGKVVIISCGTGNPYFTTDTGAALRAIEVKADVMLKGTRVDGIYTADPEKDPTATRFDSITYEEILERGLKVMDLTATALAMENRMPICVFDMDKDGNLLRLMSGENLGTVVTSAKK
jgi:uridylate kinase